MRDMPHDYVIIKPYGYIVPFIMSIIGLLVVFPLIILLFRLKEWLLCIIVMFFFLILLWEFIRNVVALQQHIEISDEKIQVFVQKKEVCSIATNDIKAMHILTNRGFPIVILSNQKDVSLHSTFYCYFLNRRSYQKTGQVVFGCITELDKIEDILKKYATVVYTNAYFF